MIKPWIERMPEHLPAAMIDSAMTQISCMAAEIGELRAAIAQPDEPVAWSITVGDDFKNCIEITHCESDAIAQYEASTEGGFESLYRMHKLYPRPRPAPYVPLTDEQIYKIWPYPEGTNSVQAVARAIEQAVRAKF